MTHNGKAQRRPERLEAAMFQTSVNCPCKMSHNNSIAAVVVRIVKCRCSNERNDDSY
jgi:hypothetical protein